jgi:ACS family tartrate transporter-like MFS transporter
MSPLYRKITLRLVPFLVLLYMVAFLDRVNISFAALTMNRDLGISESLYGFAAGVFFLGYCAFEVPANIMLTRIGARRWIAALLIVWGAVSVLTAFVPNRAVYVVARFLLGVAEAGFYPGVLFYLTLWLPRSVRTRVMALFMLAIPIVSCIGSPISAHILLMDQLAGLKGWQWLFLLEGSPALILGIATWFVLADGPDSASWLSGTEKTQLDADLRIGAQVAGNANVAVWAAIARDSAAYFLFSTALYGLSFWLPKILASAGVSRTATGWWAAVPYAAAVVAMYIAGRARGSGWLRVMYLVAAAGYAGVALFPARGAALVGFSVAAAGVFAVLPLFWAAATNRMSSSIAGTAIAIINSVGAIGAFAGPFAMGWLHDATHSYSAGLWAIAGCMVLGALVATDRISA